MNYLAWNTAVEHNGSWERIWFWRSYRRKFIKSWYNSRAFDLNCQWPEQRFLFCSSISIKYVSLSVVVWTLPIFNVITVFVCFLFKSIIHKSFWGVRLNLTSVAILNVTLLWVNHVTALKVTWPSLLSAVYLELSPWNESNSNNVNKQQWKPSSGHNDSLL